MSASSRKTYDTDSIVLRRIFAFDPFTNNQVSTNSLLAAGTGGRAIFQDGSAYLSTIGAPTSVSLVSTVTGLGTIGYLSAGTAGDVTSGQLISTVTGLGNIYLSSGGGGEVTKANLTSTTQGLGTLNYLSSPQLISTIIGLSNITVTQILAGTNVTISPLGGQGIVTINASGGSGGSGDVTSTNLTSTTLGLGTLGYISTAQLTSTTLGLGTLGYISTAQLISSIVGLSNIAVTRILAGTNITISPISGLGLVTINASGGSGDVTSTNLTSTTLGLGTLGYISTAQLTSTVAGIAQNLSTVYNISSAGGINISGTTTGFYINNTNANISTLINNNITINTTGGNVNDVDLTSTIRGLATFGYISSASLTSTTDGLASLGYISSASLTSTTDGLASLGYISSASLTSTTDGLATLGYISSSQLTSSFTSTLTGLNNIAVTQILAGTNITISPPGGRGIVTINASGSGGGGGSGDVTSTNLTSTTLGLGTLGYISSLSLVSTVQGLGQIGYVSSTALPSTVLGLSRFYVSTTGLGANLSSFSTSMASNFFTRTLTASTITADLLNVSTISFGTDTGFITFPFLRGTYISTFSSQTDYGIVSKNLSGAQLQFSSLQGDGSLLTNISTGLYSTIVGLSNIAVTQIIAGTNITISNGRGIVTINASGSGGSGGSTEVTSTNLTSTTLGLGTLGYLSSSQLISTVEGLGSIYLSTGVVPSDLTSTITGLGTFAYLSSLNSTINLSNVALFVSTNPTTTLPNLFVDTREVGSYNPIQLVVSTLSDARNYLSSYASDIGKYYHITMSGCNDSRIILPDMPAWDLNGWNLTVKNSSNSPASLTITYYVSESETSMAVNVGANLKIISNGSNYYEF